MNTGQALLFGTLAVGLLDIIDAFVFFGLRDVAPAVILQAIASGVLGQAAYEGGAATAALGALLHFLIASIIVATYFLASRWIPALRDRPLLFGPLYGVIVYAVMSLAVIPLSAAVTGPRTMASVINGVLIHAFGVGLPAALFAAATRPAVDST